MLIPQYILPKLKTGMSMPSRHVPSSVASALLLKQKTLSERYARKRSFTKKEKEEKTHFFFSSFFYLYFLSCYLIIEILASGSPSILVSP